MTTLRPAEQNLRYNKIYIFYGQWIVLFFLSYIKKHTKQLS